jgi:hypothetical protein
MPGKTLGGELAFNDVLSGDTSVVHAGQPQRFVPLHSSPSDQRVLDGVVERVAHVQRAGDVRGWKHDRVRRPPSAGVSSEQPLGDPLLVAPMLYLSRGVLRRQLRHLRRAMSVVAVRLRLGHCASLEPPGGTSCPGGTALRNLIPLNPRVLVMTWSQNGQRLFRSREYNKGPPRRVAPCERSPAVSYSPTPSRVQYHRRWRA